MQDKIKEFITLGNKAKVLLEREYLKNEPRVSVLFLNDGSISVTLNSTCFDFFRENGFETVNYENLDLLLDKCRLYVNSLEKSLDLSNVKKEETPTEKKEKYNKETFLIKTKNKKIRVKYSVCDYHKQNPNGVSFRDDKCRNIIVEELKN